MIASGLCRAERLVREFSLRPVLRSVISAAKRGGPFFDLEFERFH